jgi:hypothetical protein
MLTKRERAIKAAQESKARGEVAVFTREIDGWWAKLPSGTRLGPFLSAHSAMEAAKAWSRAVSFALARRFGV